MPVRFSYPVGAGVGELLSKDIVSSFCCLWSANEQIVTLYCIDICYFITRRDHITPVLRQLQWLPVKQRIDFKLAVLVYKSLHGLAPPYLSDDCQLVTNVNCTLTSQVFRRLHVCRPTDTVTDRRQEFLCNRTAAMEQPTDRDPEERHYVQTL